MLGTEIKMRLPSLNNRRASGTFLKLHGYIEAQREIELKDALGTAGGGGPQKGAVLDFNFFSALRSAVQFKDYGLPQQPIL